MAKQIIDVDVKQIRKISDFYDEVLKQLHAPDWHGRNVNALVDSIVYGGINGIQPPYIVRFHNTSVLSQDIAEELRFAKQAVAEARTNQLEATGIDVDVELDIA